MSLFGSSPDESSLANQAVTSEDRSLFDDSQTPGIIPNNSLFDDSADIGPSPWSLPTPKNASKGEVVKALLPSSAVPESYIDAYDLLLESGYKEKSGLLSLTGAKRVFEGSGLAVAEQLRTLSLISDGQDSQRALTRSEFHVLLALIGLAQEKEDATLDGVDERRKNLPEPSLPFVKQLRTAKVSDNLEDASPPQHQASAPPKNQNPQSSTPGKSRRLRRDSLENFDADPWGSPAMHKGHTHTVINDATPASNNITAARPIGNGVTGPSRTTSSFTTNADNSSKVVSVMGDTAGDASGGGWGSYGASNSNPITPQSGLGGEGFESAGDDQRGHAGGSIGRSLGAGGLTNRGLDETISVTLLPDKEGMFMFQHRNYEVKSARKSITVIRRYSDFVWLLDCLHKRYPFRQLPLLPPKRVAVNGRHLSADATFIEKRRRGLVRFANALVKHPILSQEQLVVMFLTVPTELAVWRKQATISVQEEFTGKALPPGLEDSLPMNLGDTFDTVRRGVRQSSESYINLCNLLERLVKRNQGVAADYLRFSHGLLSLTDSSESTYGVDTSDVRPLNDGIISTAKHLTTSQSLLIDETRAWDEGVLEDFKKQRDTLVAVRDMFDRRNRYAKDNIPQLERRIEANENKLAALMSRPEGAPLKPGEQEKLEQVIRADKQSIVDQHARGVFIKECIRDELLYFQLSQYHVSKLHQDWSQERVKYAELQAENWRAWNEEVENMPLGD